MIAERLECDVHRIQAADPYSDDYDETVARKVREQDADARPSIANPLNSIDGYDTILLASPAERKESGRHARGHTLRTPDRTSAGFAGFASLRDPG